MWQRLPPCGSQSTTSRPDLDSKELSEEKSSSKERVIYGLQENRQRNSRMATSTLVHQGLYRAREGNSGGARLNHPICLIRGVIRSPNRIFQNSESTRARSGKGPRPSAMGVLGVPRYSATPASGTISRPQTRWPVDLPTRGLIVYRE
jgi:hypothetical protein